MRDMVLYFVLCLGFRKPKALRYGDTLMSGG